MPNETALAAVGQYIAYMLTTPSNTISLKARKIVNYQRRVLGAVAVDGVNHGVYKAIAEAIKAICREVAGVESTECVLTREQAKKALALLLIEYNNERRRKKRVQDPTKAFERAFEPIDLTLRGGTQQSQ